MAIMEKYSSLQKGIDESRNEILKLQEEKENLLSQVEQLHADRSKMEKEEQVARDEAAMLQERTKSILKDGCHSFSSSSDTLMKRNQEQRRVNFIKSYTTQYRRDFWEESRNFRSAIKRLKLTTSECGLDKAISHSFLEANGISVESELVNSENQHVAALPAELLEENWHKEAMREIPASEEEEFDYSDPMNQALLAYRREFYEREKAEISLNEAMILHRETNGRSLKRRQKKDKLRAQLQSVQQATKELEQELKDIEEQTLETQALTESYRKRATAQTPLLSTSDGRPHVPKNPYSKSQNFHSTSQNHRTAIERQHPHLAGRIRMDRQFGVASIGIFCGDDILPTGNTIDTECASSSDDDDISDFVPFRRS
eukprot:CAMPEP_0194206850 /NCGR_PEP_ID=MMETSP0156-20130528/5770_1 /TAXON_ID=33649 /ORGANISM="Thalassionema nitzschioides, Strain L26-B" /LENGTH=371 /DNA_ID=CAMNT_0038933479 /DNA_START=112 /DNA_END=1227 /DNA_ORIENTATION=-